MDLQMVELELTWIDTRIWQFPKIGLSGMWGFLQDAEGAMFQRWFNGDRSALLC